jgi:hypothetical protein
MVETPNSKDEQYSDTVQAWIPLSKAHEHLKKSGLEECFVIHLCETSRMGIEAKKVDGEWHIKPASLPILLEEDDLAPES